MALAALALQPMRCDALRVAIVGAQGHLGRELVRQSLDRAWHVTAVVRRPSDPVYEPARIGWLTPEEGARHPIRDGHLLRVADAYGPLDAVLAECHAAILAVTDGMAVVRAVCAALPPTARVCLVSAAAPAGPPSASERARSHLLSPWHVAHAVKAEQEKIVRAACAGRHRIVRPRRLTFSAAHEHPDALPRRALACDLLTWVERETASRANADDGAAGGRMPATSPPGSADP